MEFKFQLICVFLVILSSLQNMANGKPQVPCYFIFGDSLSDNGNNNNLQTLAKVNYEPYGIDFPNGPTGRFCNGRTIQDVIVELMGFKQYMPSFAESKGKNILTGVNYASGSAGILDASGKQLGARIPMNEQIKNRKTIISRINNLLLRNNRLTKKLLSQCIYSVQVGSNDYINNYFKPEFYNGSRQYTLDEFSELLVQQYSQQIKTLYHTGARKFALYGVPLIGCTPNAISVYGTNGSDCVDKLNLGAILFNDRFKPLVEDLNKNLTDAMFTFLNPSGSPSDLLSFVTNSTCCKAGGGGGELCIHNSKPCSSPRRYVFWDGVHTTDAWNEAVAKSAYHTKSPLEAYPFNIHNLANHKFSV